MNRRLTLCGVAACAALVSATFSASAQTIYGTAFGGPGGEAILYNIDPNTGTATPIGAGTGFDRVSAIDFDPFTGILYGIGLNVAADKFQLITIDTTTGVGTTVGDTQGIGTAPNSAFTDISFRSDGTLFGFTGGGNIFTLNLTTGAATFVGFIGGGGNPPGSGNALAFNPSDTFYRLSGADIYTINPADGVATDTGTNVNYPGSFVNPRTNAMDYDLTTGILYASVVQGDTRPGSVPGANFIAEIDLATGVFTNPQLTVIGLDGIAIAAAVPEPATWFSALLLAGFVLIGVVRRICTPSPQINI
jgi:hypothetical protein